MGRKINMIGQKYGHLTVIEELSERNRFGKIVYRCRCDCGNYIDVNGNALRSGNTKSCGCLHSLKIEAGSTFGRLTVLGIVNDKRRGKVYKCLCTCGNITRVTGTNLITGNTRSCGCLHNEGNNTKHKQSHTKLYKVYYGMKNRCYNKKHSYYHDYGGRGIKVCDEWLNDNKTFFNWAMDNGYREGLTIDRIDLDGNYTPNNCRWTTIKDQVRNRRNTVYIEYEGVKKPMGQWSEELDVPYHTLYTRYTKGWKSKDILFGKGGKCND